MAVLVVLVFCFGYRGGKVHPGSARGAPAMAAAEVNADADLEQMVPMKKVRGSICIASLCL